jgi:mannose-1-phosphate guanylyltransferase/phosphomannomutase
MKAFILAGGEGTRLRPHTYKTPKPLLKLGGKPILTYVIENIKRAGITDYVVTVGYLHEQIVDYFGDGSDLGVNLEYAIEKERLNTAGSVLPHKDKVKGTFVVAMGDHVTNLDISDLIEHHKKSGAIATIALLKHKIPIEFGVVEVKDGMVTGFKEKPVLEQLYNIAIYVFEPEIFDHIKPKEDFARDVFPRMLEKGEKINAYIFDDVWFDIGHLDEYERLNEEFEASKLLKDLKR